MIFIFALSTFLRFSLALVNREANDNHLEVVDIILAEESLPMGEDCWECFQPKLYHSFLAGVFTIFSIERTTSRILIGQLINALAGTGTIFTLWHFVKRNPSSNKVKFFSFSLAALNPKLIGINAQVTNDSFVILWATLAFFFAYHYFSKYRRQDFFLMAIFSILSALSKGSGLIIFVVIVCVFLVRLRPLFSFRNMAFAIFVCLYFAIVPILGQYYQNHRAYGSFFTASVPKDPPPRLFEKTEVQWPGVRTIMEAYFTFRFLDLFKHPYIINYQPDFPIHMTSLWSQLYGRAHFVHFDSHPASWATRNIGILNLGRMLFVFALAPTGILVSGFAIQLWKILQKVVRFDFQYFFEKTDWIFCLLFVGFTISIILYTMQYRSFHTMKIIFIFPALISFPYFFSSGYAGMQTILNRIGKLEALITLIIFTLLFLYVMDIVSLIYQLTN